jgi:hypothetical protein
MLKSIARALNLSAEALFAQVALMHESTHPDDDATETGNGEIRGRHRGVFVAMCRVPRRVAKSHG